MFLVLMVEAPEPPAPPPSGGAINVSDIAGGRSRISNNASQGGRHVSAAPGAHYHFICQAKHSK
jgi:hypothetical protein